MFEIGIGETESSKEVEFAIVDELGSFPVIVQVYAAQSTLTTDLVSRKADRHTY